MNQTELKDFLESKVAQYNNPVFIESDPIQVPHEFDHKEDIEIAAFLTSTIAWGNRKMIIRNARKMMEITGNSPHDYIMSTKDFKLDNFVHRTFNVQDLNFFMRALQHIYQNHDGLESLFFKHANPLDLQESIHHFKRVFFELDHPLRTTKHISDPLKGSAAKRINMFLRWMIRSDPSGVDFGIWKSLSPSQLSCPLDVHSGRVARRLGLLKRTQNDARAVAELDRSLRAMDPDDPVKYDYALFGLGAFEKF